MSQPEPTLTSAPDVSALTAALSTIAPTWRGRAGREMPTQATGFASLDAVLPGGGWPLGALIELVPALDGIGEVSLTLPAIRQLCRRERRVVFVDPPFMPDPPALHGRGLPLDRTLWVTTRGEAERLWVAVQLLREQTIGAVLVWVCDRQDHVLRKLQLAAESGQGLAFVFRSRGADGAGGRRVLDRPSPAAVRAELSPALSQGLNSAVSLAGSVLEVRLHKVRGGRPGTARITLPAIRL